jgi:endonuclease/exonuclease/phosphatase family metal-dependent hydrolase
VYSTHLNWRLDHSGARQSQVRQLCEFVAGSRPRSYPAVIGGDFNADPTSDEIRTMTGRAAVPVDRTVFLDAWETGGDGRPAPTWSVGNPYAAAELEPDRRIDYIFAGWPRAGGAGQVTSCRVAGAEPIDGVWPSDHFAVVAELRY